MPSTPRALRLMKAQAEPLKDALTTSRQNKGTMDRIKFKAKNASATAIVETGPLREALRNSRRDKGMMNRIKFKAKDVNTPSATTATDKPAAPSEAVVAEAGKLGPQNAAAAALWLGLIAWTCIAAPGQVGDPADSAMLALLVAQPASRGH